MNDQIATELAQKILKNIFQTESNFTIEELKRKFAFDLNLPEQVKDATTGEETWSIIHGAQKYITQQNMEERDKTEGWMLPKCDLRNIDDIIKIWEDVNYCSTNRLDDSIDVYKSDTIYRSEKVYQSVNCFSCKNLIFCDSCSNCSYSIGSKRSGSSNYCIRLDDSINSSNSFSVSYSNKIVNSFFIQDCFDLYECMFCAHIASKKFCIANMQFSESEYRAIKTEIIKWILKE